MLVNLWKSLSHSYSYWERAFSTSKRITFGSDSISHFPIITRQPLSRIDLTDLNIEVKVFDFSLALALALDSHDSEP